MSTKKKYTPKRSSDQATLTISLPRDLKTQIEDAARDDNRTVSNYIATEIMRMIREQKAQK